MMEMNIVWSCDAFPTLCERHGLADVFDSEECHSCVTGKIMMSVIPDDFII